mgnify:CR=1 FL=1
MKKEYDTSVKEAIERVMSVFSEYIKTTPYFDIVWSGKVGYIYISIDSCRGTVGDMDCLVIDSPEELLDKLNQYLPEDVAVISCQEAVPRFHARLNAVGKTYCYRIHNSKIPAVFDRRLVWQIEQQLDVDAMKTAAKYLVGTHDFAAFTSAKNKKKSTVRSIESILFEQNGADIRISFRGDGFLFHMVRILTGTLVEVGLGVRRPEEIAAILDGKDRQKAGMLAPASGLCLMEVYYQ